MPITYACLIEKGGTGKTTTAVHLAEAFARAGKRVLVIDLDPQANATRWIGPTEAPAMSAMELCLNADQGIASAIVPSSIKGVSIICGARALGMADRLLSTTPEGNPRNPMTVIRRALKKIPKEYDVILLDCPPSVGLMNANAIVAADHLIIPVDPSELTYDGFAHVAMTLTQLLEEEVISQVPAISVLFTKWDARLKVARRVQDRIVAAEEKPYRILAQAIRERVIMRDLPGLRKTAWDAPQASEIAQDYEHVARELAAQ